MSHTGIAPPDAGVCHERQPMPVRTRAANTSKHVQIEKRDATLNASSLSSLSRLREALKRDSAHPSVMVCALRWAQVSSDVRRKWCKYKGKDLDVEAIAQGLKARKARSHGEEEVRGARCSFATLHGCLSIAQLRGLKYIRNYSYAWPVKEYGAEGNPTNCADAKTATEKVRNTNWK